MFVPDQGDIVVFNFDPSAGKEVMKRRPAIVMSKKIFNEHAGFAVVAPITSTVRNMKLEVVLPEQFNTQGAVMVYQMKSLDFIDRKAEFIEKVDEHTISQVTAIAKAIIS